jgi:hypothetical protein
MTATQAAAPPVRIPVNGKPVRLRAAQMLAWSAAAGACGAALVAGLYFLVLQVNWHVHIGSVQFRIFYLKPWFDGGMGIFRSASWVLYRHGERDLLEPAAAVMGVMTLLAKPKWWGVRAGPVRLVTAPLVLLAVAVALAAGGVWLLDFGLPHAWHSALGSYRVTAPGWISHSSWQNFVLGFLIGRVLHRIWAPVGATIQGYQIDKAVDRTRLRHDGRRPLWVRWPLMAPVVRERFAWIMAHDTEVQERDATSKALIAVIAVACFLLTAAGFIAHYWIGAGHTFPYLAP